MMKNIYFNMKMIILKLLIDNKEIIDIKGLNEINNNLNDNSNIYDINLSIGL